MNVDEMKARIAQLESELQPKRAKASRRSEAKSFKAAQKARKAQFKLEAWKRAHLHSSLNRYHC
jgi:hypothetical protein